MESYTEVFFSNISMYILENFRDTLVATDLDQANRIAYGKTRYRVITLNGELIETSGAMSGGGNQKQQGKMGTQVTKYFSSTMTLYGYCRYNNQIFELF